MAEHKAAFKDKADQLKQRSGLSMALEEKMTGTAIQEKAAEKETVPEKQETAPKFRLPIPRSNEEPVELEEGKDFTAGSKVSEHFKSLKAARAAAEQKASELETKLKEAEEKLGSGTTLDQIKAHEEYKKLEVLANTAQAKISEYEESLKRERELRAEKEDRLAALDLNYDPQFQETYVKPINKLHSKITKSIQGFSDSAEQAQQVQLIVERAVQAQDDAQFYSEVRKLKEILPEDYGLIFPEVSSLRDLVMGQVQAIVDHDKTSQSLRVKAYSDRERTVPDTLRAVDRIRGEIAALEAPLEEQMATPEFKTFIISKGINPDAIEKKLRDSIRKAHVEGQLNEEVIELAVQGARKMQLMPVVAYSWAELERVNEELRKTRKELDEIKGTSSTRSGQRYGVGGEVETRDDLKPLTREEVMKMSGSDRRRSSFAERIRNS